MNGRNQEGVGLDEVLDRVDWNAELVRGDLGKSVAQLKQEPGNGLFVGGVRLPLALAKLGLIGSWCIPGWRLVSRLEFGSGAVAMRYEPKS